LHDHYLYNDNITDGREIVIDNFDVWYNNQDHVIVDLLTLNKSTYEFFKTMDMIEDNDNSGLVDTFIPVTTYNPNTNLTNGALGYFHAHTISTFSSFID
jgi:hypothetical protein